MSTPIQVGPLVVLAPCSIQSRVTSQGTIMIIPCPAHLRNVSQATQFVTAQTITVNGPPPIGETAQQVVYPNQVLTLPPPPSGQAWQVVVVSRSAVRRLTDDIGEVALVVLGLAGYGAYALYRDRNTLWHHIRRLF